MCQNMLLRAALMVAVLFSSGICFHPRCAHNYECGSRMACINNRCYPGCKGHTDCPYTQACYQHQCVNPCEGTCGVDAKCRVVKHKPICECPYTWTGNPFESCRPFNAGITQIIRGHTHSG